MNPKPLSVQEAQELVGSYLHRRSMWPDETEDMALMVVLLNAGDGRTRVTCMGGEWTGTKSELTVRRGAIPTCPFGHVLTESPERIQLAYIEVPR